MWLASCQISWPVVSWTNRSKWVSHVVLIINNSIFTYEVQNYQKISYTLSVSCLWSPTGDKNDWNIRQISDGKKILNKAETDFHSKPYSICNRAKYIFYKVFKNHKNKMIFPTQERIWVFTSSLCRRKVDIVM